MNHFDVVCIGIVLLDLPLGPIKGDIFSRETTMVDQIQLTTGGDAMNEAVILSRLGSRVALIGQIGRDMQGDIIVKRCEEEKIYHKGLYRDPDFGTRINVVLFQEDGQRSFIKNRSAISGSFRETEIDFELMKGARVVSLASIFASKLRDKDIILKILKKAKEFQATTFADMVPITGGETIETIQEALPLLDYFLPNLEEARMLTGFQEPDDIADCLLNYGVKNVIIKLGKEGCFIKNRQSRYLVPGFPAKTIDTTGAGDNFAAGFISAFLEGKSLRDAGLYANGVAAVSTESIGAVSGVKNKEQIEVYLRDNTEKLILR
jgi:sugar/nucleoside kinase (ribokinase family)